LKKKSAVDPREKKSSLHKAGEVAIRYTVQEEGGESNERENRRK